MREIKKIIIHCSDSEWGNAKVIDKWHKERGWDEIGYHFVITNGYLTPELDYVSQNDGRIETGRDIDRNGAHCYGHNKDSIGICLIGVRKFTGEQLLTSLPFLVKELMDKHGLTKDDVYPHHKFNTGKSCPNLSEYYIRRLI